jgi:hypothetical protein
VGCLVYNSEIQLFISTKETGFDRKNERSVCNKRCEKKLVAYMEQMWLYMSQKNVHLSQLFIVDSSLVKLCKVSCLKCSTICATVFCWFIFDSCAAHIKPYFGCKLHLICDEDAIMHSFDFTTENLHDVNYLKNVKYKLGNCGLVGANGCISDDYQDDLFFISNIKLSVPMRSNPLNPHESSKIKRCKGKRNETLFSHHDGQFSMNIYFAKSFSGLAIRMISIITALIMIQYLNLFVFNRKLKAIMVNLT